MDWLIRVVGNINRICQFCGNKYGEIESTSSSDSHGVCPDCGKLGWEGGMKIYRKRMNKEKEDGKVDTR